MLSRSKRSELHSNATTAEIGPGAYDVSGSLLRPVKHGVAPFGSTAQRSNMAQVDQMPGPGAYFKETVLRGTNVKPTPQFASRIDRIPIDRRELETRDLPGPGAYTGDIVQPPRRPVGGRPASGKQFHAAEGINWVKVATAPSIPTVAQSYGYEEGPNGALVQQHNPLKGHTGVGRDTLGPGEYEPRIHVTKPTRHAPNFGASSAGRHEVVSKDALSRPGPGSYEVALAGTGPTFHGGVLAERQTSSFASTSKRSAENKQIGPGPGAYRTPSSFVPLREHLAAHPETFQAFGRTVDDGLQPRREASAPPGPGHYDPPKEITAFSSTKKKGLSAFVSTAPRFDASMAAAAQDAAPGPGAYEVTEISLTNKLAHKVSGRFGAFGSTASRFEPTKEPVPGAAAPVGPGAYNPPVSVPNPAEQRRKDARSAAFRSTSRRADLGVAMSGAPTFYDLPTEWTKPTTTSKAFLSNQPRFADAQRDIIPAPGQYNVPVLPPKVSHSKVGSDIGRAPRFASAKTDLSPGPGAYNTVPGMIRRTFNISIGS